MGERRVRFIARRNDTQDGLLFHRAREAARILALCIGNSGVLVFRRDCFNFYLF
jgi:hypothetical protein